MLSDIYPVYKGNIPSYYDGSLSGISFRNTNTTIGVLGTEINFVEVDKNTFQAKFYNRDQNQLLTLIRHADDSKYEISEFIVEVNSEYDPGVPILDNIPTFISARNIQIGLSSKYVIKKLGYDFDMVSRGIKSVVVYQKSKIRTKLDHYYGKYYFENDELKKFQFGYSYP